MTNDIKTMFQAYVEAGNIPDVEKSITFFTDDCVYEDAALHIIARGKKELRSFLSYIYREVPDFHIELKSFFNSGHWAASEWIMSGAWTQSTDPKVQPTGKSFAVPGASIIEIKDGKILRNTDYWNLTDYRQQVGLQHKSVK